MQDLANRSTQAGATTLRPAADKVAVRVLSITTALAAILIACALMAAVDFYEKKDAVKQAAFRQANACTLVSSPEGKPAYRCAALSSAVLTADELRRRMREQPIPKQ